jgi:hypothetical protein
MKHIALVMGLTLVTVASVSANGLIDCPTASSDTTVTSTCNTGITWTGGNLTIGTPTSGGVSVSNDYAFDSPIKTSAGSLFGSFTNTENGIIVNSNTNPLNTLFTVYIDTTISTLTNAGSISSDNYKGTGIQNVGNITSLTNSGSISTTGNLAEAISIGYGGIITSLTNTGSISTTGRSANGIDNIGMITTLSNIGEITVGASSSGIVNYYDITTLTNSGTISAADGGVGIYNEGTITTLNN